MNKNSTLYNFKCCGGTDASPENPRTELRYPKEHCMDCDEHPGVTPPEHGRCDNQDCEQCCVHEFDPSEGGHCLNCGKHINN